MSKQDRQGVRTAQDIERKYNLGGFAKGVDTDKISQLAQSLSQFVIEMRQKFSSIYSVGSIYINTNNENPSIVFGGTWELVSQGYLVVGTETEENAPAELEYLDKCYIWKRTA